MLILLITPASCVIAVFIFPSSRILSSLIIGGMIPFIINSLLMITSKCMKVEDKKAKYAGIDDLNIYFFS
jgi:hypothetical protein